MGDPSHDASIATETARQTLRRITNAALATVSPNGTPWNSPVYVAFDGRVFHWASSCTALHSRNLAANPQVCLAVFDSTAADDSGHCVYVAASAHELTDRSAIAGALENLARRKGEPARPVDDFVASRDDRVYEAVPSAIWTNVVRQEDGHYHDDRIRIDAGRLGRSG